MSTHGSRPASRSRPRSGSALLACGAVLAGAALGPGGCKSSEPSPSPAPPTVAMVELARALGPDLAAPRPLARVVVGKSGIGLDTNPLFDSWPESAKAEAVRAAGHDPGDVIGVKPRVVGLVEFRPEGAAPAAAPSEGAARTAPPLPALHEALVRLAAAERAHRGGASASGDLALAIRLDRLAPYPLVAQVVSTAQRAGYGALELAVQSPGGAEVVLPHRFPRPGEPACSGPLLTVFSGGVALRVTEGIVAVGAAPAPGPAAVAPGAPTSWQSRLVVAADGACPAAPRRDGAHDAARLASLLAALRREAPPCARAIVTATASTTWADLAPVLETATVGGGLTLLQLGEPTAASDAALALCPGARKLGALP